MGYREAGNRDGFGCNRWRLLTGAFHIEGPGVPDSAPAMVPEYLTRTA